MTEWECITCGHKVFAHGQPASIFWDDGHICHFGHTIKETEHDGSDRKDNFASEDKRNGTGKTWEEEGNQGVISQTR